MGACLAATIARFATSCVNIFMDRELRRQFGWEFMALLGLELLSTNTKNKDAHILWQAAGKILQDRFAENSPNITNLLANDFKELTPILGRSPKIISRLKSLEF